MATNMLNHTSMQVQKAQSALRRTMHQLDRSSNQTIASGYKTEMSTVLETLSVDLMWLVLYQSSGMVGVNWRTKTIVANEMQTPSEHIKNASRIISLSKRILKCIS